MTHPTAKRGHARRQCVRTRATYTLWRLDEANAPPPRDDLQLSPAALWILLAYLPPHVRRQPWVRHLVQRQLGSAHERTPVEQVQLSALAEIARRDEAPDSPRVAI